ncbi:MAG TPA: hypothetical protein ENI48_12350 [Thioploca sp.]|nr:hypothetical protein [Thioploca sp.]
MKLSPILRKLFNINRLLLTIATVLVIWLAIIGHLVRDRTIILAFMMYIPLAPLGLWAILLDLSQAGRSLPKLRFVLTFIGLGLIVWGSLTMIGTGNALTNAAPNTVSLLHWNVKWGGVGYDNYLKGRYDGGEWASIRTEISQRYQP